MEYFTSPQSPESGSVAWKISDIIMKVNLNCCNHSFVFIYTVFSLRWLWRQWNRQENFQGFWQCKIQRKTLECCRLCPKDWWQYLRSHWISLECRSQQLKAEKFHIRHIREWIVQLWHWASYDEWHMTIIKSNLECKQLMFLVVDGSGVFHYDGNLSFI